MRRSRASMNPVQQAAAIAREDLPGNYACPHTNIVLIKHDTFLPTELASSTQDGHAASSSGMPQADHLLGRPSLSATMLQVPGKGVSLQQQEQPSQGARVRRLGALQGLPVVAPSNESLSSALKRASKASATAMLCVC
eukprot:887841-Pelagomonas_calceolata.AAC.2